jgi:hypothetical protein
MPYKPLYSDLCMLLLNKGQEGVYLVLVFLCNGQPGYSPINR